jgi:hypothetical protein
MFEVMVSASTGKCKASYVATKLKLSRPVYPSIYLEGLRKTTGLWADFLTLDLLLWGYDLMEDVSNVYIHLHLMALLFALSHCMGLQVCAIFSEKCSVYIIRAEDGDRNVSLKR